MYLHGHRNITTDMWMVDLLYHALKPGDISHPLGSINVDELNKKRDIISFLHKAAFSPVPLKWIESINAGFITTWPGLIEDLVKKNCPNQPPPSKGISAKLGRISDLPK